MDTTEAAATQAARYAKVNGGWPEEIPPLTHTEAKRAVRRLFKKFAGRRPGNTEVRRVWVPAKPPFNTLHRGWRRLVHDVSHDIHRLKSSYRPHDWRHEKLEAEMVRYVLDQGWLSGKLKPPEKPSPAPKEKRYQSVVARIETWERKRKRAETAL